MNQNCSSSSTFVSRWDHKERRVKNSLSLHRLYFAGDMFRGNCTCRNIYCRRVAQTDAFLFPFMIEFCLISTCLLYVTWRKVGKKPKPAHEIFKPCYKLYRAYKGLFLILDFHFRPVIVPFNWKILKILI